MTFKRGDLVEVIKESPVPIGGLSICKGMFGVIIDFHAPYISADGALERYWEVNFSGKHVFGAESALRRVPHDPEGRKAVGWDWHSLNLPANTLAWLGSSENPYPPEVA